ncbi:hypothetical protein PPL_05000 [Heterostelium album PN500]|uniref:Uncharacterized protein n=1 Tax=Heterostelium pallidum (strain ATCC 26659 / Pp 5 / PN500) TaxID=670386 RepID=D3B956_HETP5|nr:hypothetical protein PPL_05000 [Heterostelium album PN500]EFA82095.1 hypothetical protein PPL_05000 [Heterostelium album PN500]|eukprot:XP_020434212.1 hypothetical protein PPL_05000 [Heterostelium album PN500]
MVNTEILVGFLSIAGNILSISTQLSPIKSFIEMDKTRDPGLMNIYPIFALCGNSFLWVTYGLLTTQFTILPVNTFGVFITLYFVMIFISSTNEYLKVNISSKTSFLFPIQLIHNIFYFHFFLEAKTFSYILCFCNITGGIRRDNSDVAEIGSIDQIPNFVGAVLSFFQLLVYKTINLMYPKGRMPLGVDPNENITFIDEEKASVEMVIDGRSEFEERI